MVGIGKSSFRHCDKFSRRNYCDEHDTVEKREDAEKEYKMSLLSFRVAEFFREKF